MKILNTANARIIDPLLTNHLRGYTHAERVGHILFPKVPVLVRGGKRIEFGKESFRLYNTRRAAGSATKRIQFGYEGKPFSLEQHALEGKVPFEFMAEADKVPGFNLGQRAVNVVSDVISLDTEYLAATRARDAANYDANHKVVLAGADQWDDAASDPKADIKAAKSAIRATCGHYPNVMVISPKVFEALDDHPKILEKFKYTSSDSITVEMLAKYFDVDRVVVGKSVYADETNNDEFADLWGLDVVLAYVATNQDVEVPSYGYTYQLEGFPIVEEPYSERNAKSWFYPVTDELSPELVGAEAGFLIQNAVSGA